MKKYIPYLLAVVLLLLTLYQCAGNREDEKRWAANAESLADSLSYFRNALGSVTASRKTLEYDKAQLQELVLSKDRELEALAAGFSEVKHMVHYETVTRFDTLRAIYKDTIPLPFVREGVVAGRWYSFGYRTDQKGLEIDSLTIPTGTTVLTGLKRKWLLGRQTLTTDITNSNPYIKVTRMEAVEVALPQPWYRKWYVWLAAGIVGGVIVR